MDFREASGKGFPKGAVQQGDEDSLSHRRSHVHHLPGGGERSEAMRQRAPVLQRLHRRVATNAQHLSYVPNGSDVGNAYHWRVLQLTLSQIWEFGASPVVALRTRLSRLEQRRRNPSARGQAS